MRKYLRIWLLLTFRATQIAFVSRFGAVVFLIGKFLRFFFFFFFIFIIFSKTKAIASYNIWQIMFFFASFNLVDNMAQFFLREVYRFRNNVLMGFFDYVLTKPFSPLFRSLFGGSDVLDLSIITLSIGTVLFSITKIGEISLIGIILYFFLIVNAFIIALAFHIAVLGIGILTTEVDNTIMLYRDLTQMGRVPVDIYREPVRGIITFIIPVGIMMTFPSKALMGLLSFNILLFSFLFGGAALFLSLKFWNYSLKHYQSASS